MNTLSRDISFVEPVDTVDDVDINGVSIEPVDWGDEPDVGGDIGPGLIKLWLIGIVTGCVGEAIKFFLTLICLRFFVLLVWGRHSDVVVDTTILLLLLQLLLLLLLLNWLLLLLLFVFFKFFVLLLLNAGDMGEFVADSGLNVFILLLLLLFPKLFGDVAAAHAPNRAGCGGNSPVADANVALSDIGRPAAIIAAAVWLAANNWGVNIPIACAVAGCKPAAEYMEAAEWWWW